MNKFIRAYEELLLSGLTLLREVGYLRLKITDIFASVLFISE